MSINDTLPIPTLDDGRRDGPTPQDGVNMPLAQAVRSLQELNRPFDPTAHRPGLQELSLQVAALGHAMDGACSAGGDCEIMLYTQARVLDAMFKRMITRDIHSSYKDAAGIPFLRTEELDLALRSQKQCRTTIEALGTLQQGYTGGADDDE